MGGVLASPVDYDFSQHNLMGDHSNLKCVASILKDGPYGNGILANAKNLAQGTANIHNGRVSLEAEWLTGGISSDPKYLTDEFNVRVTDEGYLVGKFAFFSDSGEPTYLTLSKNNHSVPVPEFNAEQLQKVKDDGQRGWANQAQEWVKLSGGKYAYLTVVGCDPE